MGKSNAGTEYGIAEYSSYTSLIRSFVNNCRIFGTVFGDSLNISIMCFNKTDCLFGNFPHQKYWCVIKNSYKAQF